MRVNVVAKLGWILERLARELEPLGYVSVNCGQVERRADPEADLNYYMPARDLLKFPAPGRVAGLYTHGPTAFEIAERFEVCVTMNRRMGELLGSSSRPLSSPFTDYPVARPRRVETIRPGAGVPPRPIRFGVVGRVYGKTRKGADLVERAVATGFDFRACSQLTGRRPPCPITHAVENRGAFYQSIDYLVVTSTDEGGPIPVVEALAHGVPVVAPDVGWCWEFPVIRYELGSWPSLLSVLRGLTEPPTWREWRVEHGRIFESILGASRRVRGDLRKT